MSNLSTYAHIEQRSDEWHALRRGILTASTIGRLITPKTRQVAANPESRALTAQLAAERLAGFTEENYVTNAMWRGIDDEPRAVEQYSKDHHPVTPMGFMIRQWPTFKLGYSPDGMVGDDGLIEVKSRSPKEQVKVVIEAEIPAEHLAQLHCGLLVSGRAWVDYVSYCGGLPMWVKRVHPDQEWRDAILTAAAAFEAACNQAVADFTKATAGLTWTERIDHSIPFGLEF